MTEQDIAVIAWSSLNPFGEKASYLLLAPRSGVEAQVGADLAAVAQSSGLRNLAGGTEIPFIGTEDLAIALRGTAATLWAGPEPWLTFPAGDAWTADAIARRYIVLVIGTRPSEPDLSPEQITDYLSHSDGVGAGLVRIRLRVTEN